MFMKKIVKVDPRAAKEFVDFPDEVKEDFLALIRKLEELGQLMQPEAKKLSGYKNLFELRVIISGQWRGFYAYLTNNEIIILHFMRKKTQKTPTKDLNLVEKRLKEYLN